MKNFSPYLAKGDFSADFPFLCFLSLSVLSFCSPFSDEWAPRPISR